MKNEEGNIYTKDYCVVSDYKDELYSKLRRMEGKPLTTK